MSMYTDREVDDAIASFRAGGELFGADVFARLSDAQQRRVVDALGRAEWSTLCAWARAWRDQELPEPPPGPRFVWAQDVPDTPEGL